ncbi:hypothetical protein QTI05_22600 [Variovorax sp. J22R193]|uniref:hypothetical protein n=1 Tax=Variovorax fucosicus TaxID=3053517 RepID=UPI00257666D3|nr:hypothetical protein [Variovorax sp. J22R193]MDM0041848.1 hypothetical protein [Variovorax sp. J22R193]
MFSSPLIEPLLLIVIGICGSALCFYLGDLQLTSIFALVAAGGVYEYHATLLHEQDLKKFDR